MEGVDASPTQRGQAGRARQADQAGRTGRDLSLAVVCLLTFVVYLDSSITPVALPAIRSDIGADVRAAQWLLDAYTLAFAALLLTAGTLGDRIGHGVVLIIGGVGFTVCSAACALAPDAPALIAARAGQGVFAAAIVPLSLAVTSARFPDPAARARAIGVWGGTAGVAVALGPLVGGFLVEQAGWRSVFWVNVPIGVVAVAGLLRYVPRSPGSGTGRVDTGGQALFVTGIAALTFALIDGREDGWGSPVIVGLLASSGVTLALFAWWEARCRWPMLPPGLLRIPAVAVACTVNLLGFMGLYAVLFLLTSYLQGTVGLSPMETGARFLALTGLLGAVSIAGFRIAGRLGTRTTMVLGLVLAGAGFGGLVLVDRAGYPGYAWALALVGAGVPLSGGVVAIQAMMGRVPPAMGATASATMNTFRQMGAVLGVALAGILSPTRDGRVTSMDVTFIVSAAAALVAAALVAIAFREREPAPTPAETKNPRQEPAPTR